MTDYIQILLLTLILLILLDEFSAKRLKKNTKSVVLDTSALIDGRILEIAKTGFLPGDLIVPKFVVNELQLLADGGDSHKRERARFGLDVIVALQNEVGSKVKLSEKDYKSIRKTDDKLVEMAKSNSFYLCTLDFNLNKVAVVNGIEVLNVNELAQSVRPSALPGERHSVKIVQKGSNKDQGVGYLEDGTMVVVSGAGKKIGRKVDVSVTRMLQTEAGKMMFAKLSE